MCIWDVVGDVLLLVVVIEKIYEEDEDVSEIDQFMMLYERYLSDGNIEFLLVVGEEKIVG